MHRQDLDRLAEEKQIIKKLSHQHIIIGGIEHKTVFKDSADRAPILPCHLDSPCGSPGAPQKDLSSD
jgi:hypothetical protein